MNGTEKADTSLDRYNAHFAATLRQLMTEHGTTQALWRLTGFAKNMMCGFQK